MKSKKKQHNLHARQQYLVGNTLRKWMREKEITDSLLARRVGIPRSTLRSYLDDRLVTVNLDTLEAIASALGKTLPEMLEQTSAARGFFKKDSSEGKYNISNLTKYLISIECDTPLNPYHTSGFIHFYPRALYKKKTLFNQDCWVHLECLGGIIALEYNAELSNLHAGKK